MLHQPGSPHQLSADTTPANRTLVDGRRDDESVLAFGRRRLNQRAWVVPVILLVVSAAIFSAFAWKRLQKTSADPHFIYLANTLNSMVAAAVSDDAADRRDGKVAFELDRHPPHNNDWASWWDLTTRGGQHYRGIWLDQAGHGRFKTLGGKLYVLERSEVSFRQRTKHYYVSFPPGPAVLMMPLAAIWGYHVNDVIFTIFFAALNVMLMYLLLRRMSVGGRSGRGRRENLWLTLLFGFGSVHLWCSVLGQVWFTALVVGVTFTLLYLICAIDAKHPFLAGLFLALGFATRTPLLFTAVFFFAFVFFPGGTLRKKNWAEALRQLAVFCAPCLVVGVGLLWMNEVRFGAVAEFGHTYLASGRLKRIQRFGLFNFHFLSKNLSAMLTLVPRFQPDPPFIVGSKHGMSLFLSTPAFVYLFLPEKRRCDADRFWFRLLWITVAVCALPGLMYQNTGFAQYGYRFSMDYLPYLVLLLAVGRRPLSRLFKSLVLLGVVVNAFGAVTFKRFDRFYSDKFFV